MRRLNRDQGRTMVLVLHDLNLACRYADHMIAMRDGRIVAAGAPGEVITAATMRAVFGLECTVIADPTSGTPMVVPGVRGPCGGGDARAAGLSLTLTLSPRGRGDPAVCPIPRSLAPAGEGGGGGQRRLAKPPRLAGASGGCELGRGKRTFSVVANQNSARSLAAAGRGNGRGLGGWSPW